MKFGNMDVVKAKENIVVGIPGSLILVDTVDEDAGIFEGIALYDGGECVGSIDSFDLATFEDIRQAGVENRKTLIRYMTASLR